VTEVPSALDRLVVRAEVGKEKARNPKEQGGPDREHQREVDATEEEDSDEHRHEEDPDDAERDLFGEVAFETPTGDRKVRP
jgi:hypothetical protein